MRRRNRPGPHRQRPTRCRRRAMNCEVSVPNPPQLAQLIQSRFHPFDGGRIRLRSTAPAQSLADVLERNFPAHRPFQYVGSDLADGLRRLPISLPMEELVFRLRHAGEGAEVGPEDPGEVDRSDRVVEAGVIPVMTIFLPAAYCSSRTTSGRLPFFRHVRIAMRNSAGRRASRS